MDRVLDLINDNGGYAGAASLIGLAVLALLYFAQAREVKRLREWAGRAPERAAELEARVAAEAARRAATPAPKPVTAAPVAKAANGGQAQPGAAAAAAAAAAPGAPPAAGAPAPGTPNAPAKAPAPAGATASGAATTPGDTTTPGAPAATPSEGAPSPGAPAAGAAAATASGAATATPAAPGGTGAATQGGDGTTTPGPGGPDEGAAATPEGEKTGDGTPSGDGAGPGDTGEAPAVDQPTGITPAGAGLPPARTAAARPRGAAPVRPAAPARAAGAPTATVPPRAGGSRRGSTGGMRWPVLAIAGALLVIVVGIVFITSGGDDEAPQGDNAAQTEPEVLPPAQTEPAEDRTPRGEVTVAVLNGTSVPGLARRVAEKIEGAGFDVPDDLVTNAVEQNRSATVVMYAEGARDEAREVARVIDVGTDALDVMDESARTVTQDRAMVVVTVGADQSQP